MFSKKNRPVTMVKVLNTFQWVRNVVLYRKCATITRILFPISILILMYIFVSYFEPLIRAPITPSNNGQLQIGAMCDTIGDPTNLTTLVIMSYTNNEALMRILSQYNDCNKFGGIIYEIVIVWNNPTVLFNYSHTSLHIDSITHKIAINVYQQKKNSMANRWFISRHHKFKTLSAIFIDDDMYLNQYTISCMLETFLMNKFKIIAPSRTSMRTTRQFVKNDDDDDDGEEYAFEYKNENFPYFDMLLPGMSMFNTQYLPNLALLLEEYDLLTIIDEQIAHCDDIAMILSMSMLNDGKKYFVGIEHILINDYSIYRPQKALYDPSKVDIRYQQRSQCLTMILNKIISHNKEKHKLIINPIVHHQRQNNTINCRTCEWCDTRGCFYK